MSKIANLAATVEKLRAAGLNWHAIAKELGVSTQTARCSVDLPYREIIYERNNARRRGKTKRPVEEWKPKTVFVVPPTVLDSRSAFSRMMGDPLPGRSALDQRGDP